MTAGAAHEVRFDVATVPFSYAGSWMALSVPKVEEELFFRNYHGRANNLFPVRVIANGAVVTPQVEAEPWRLVLRHGDGAVEICFASPDTVRMRGTGGLGVRFGGKNLVHPDGPGRVTINKPPTRRYQVEMLRGRVQLHQLVATQPLFPIEVEAVPDGDGGWELALDEFWSTWRRPGEREDFDACVAAARAAFETFRDAMPPAREQDAAARTLAAYVNWSCIVNPCGLIRRPTLLMSKNWMSNVWSWDQCFNAMALAAGEPVLALDQMLTLVDHQDAFGCYPDSVNDLVIQYNFAKPPVHGWAFREMLRRMPARPPRDVMETLYTSFGRQADWWMTDRVWHDEDGASTGLPHYLHGNDSGWDNSTMFSKGVPLVAPDLAALLVLQMDVLAELARELDRPDEATRWAKRADVLYAGLMAHLWAGDHFEARLAKTGESVACKSLVPWLPIILGDRLPEDVQACLRRGIETHLTDWGLATERVDSARYREDGYWQGPIWAPATYIAVTGLDRCGFHDLADAVSERFCRMCGASGFAENFNAQTGASLRDPAYTWTASVFLLLAQRMAQRTSD